MRKTKQRTDMITAADVRGIRFPLIRRGGYDPRQVDPFLELVARSLEGGGDGPKVDAQYVHSVRFATVRRGGYAPTAVDAFLDQVIDTIDPPDGVANEPQLVGAAAAAVDVAPGAAPEATVSAGPDIAPPAPVVTGAPPPPVFSDAPPPPPPPPPAETTADAPVEDPSPVAPDPTTEAAQPLVANGAAVSSVPENPSALEVGRAHLERLKVLYEAGVLSDKEVTVLAQRVKRRAREQHQLSQN